MGFIADNFFLILFSFLIVIALVQYLTKAKVKSVRIAYDDGSSLRKFKGKDAVILAIVVFLAFGLFFFVLEFLDL